MVGRAAASGSTAGQAAQPSPELSRRAARELEALEMEAGIERGHDPMAPGGDLKRDLEEFTTLEACVRGHAVADPVLADAVDALGYDTLVRDACRTLHALKAKDGKLCQPIAASPVRQRCESQVAVLAGEPTLCPLVAGVGAVPGREPICLARASRDERLCAAVVPSEGSVCRALVQGRAAECGGDDACVRQVERFRSLLEKPANHTPFPARLHIEFASERGKTADAIDGSFDLDEVAAAGAVARTSGDKIRLMVGTPRTVLWPSWEAPSALPHVALTLSVPSAAPPAAGGTSSGRAKTSKLVAGGAGGPGSALGPSDLSLDLLIPRVALLSGMLASDRRVVVEQLSASAGSPIRLTLTTKVSDAARVFRVKIELETFVRDGADPRPSSKKGL